MKPSNFVRVFGYLFSVFFLVTLLWFCYHIVQTPESPPWVGYFLGANLVFYFLGSLGLLSRRLFGYYALKVFLYVLLLSFPIGTLMAVRILGFMKRESVRSLFG